LIKKRARFLVPVAALAAGAAALVPVGASSAEAAGAYVPHPIPVTSCGPDITSPLSNPQLGNPKIFIVDPACDFAPITNSSGQDISNVYTGYLPDSPAGGIAQGGESAYRVEVPKNWNGTLVMYAHGYVGTGNTVAVSNPRLSRAAWNLRGGPPLRVLP